MDLTKMVTEVLSGNAAQSVGSAANVQTSDVQKVLAAGVPMILGGLAKNASSTTGAQAIDTAISQNHTGSLLDDVTQLFTSGQGAHPDGAKILGHVFGNSQSTAASKVSAQTGVSADAVNTILSYAAPVVLAQLGKQKATSGLDAGGLSKILLGQTDPEGNPLLNIATALFDKNHDGSLVDDVLGMFLGKKR